MKNKIISVLLSVLIISFPFVSGCRQTDDSAGGNAPKEKLANVYSSHVVSIPEEYSESVRFEAIHGDRVYAVSNNTVCSFDISGESFEVMEYKLDPDFGYLRFFRICSDESEVFLQSSGSEPNEYLLVKRDSDGNNIFSVSVLNMFPEPATGYDMGNSFGIHNMLVDSENRIYLVSYSTVVVISNDGEKLFDVSVSDIIWNSFLVSGNVVIDYSDVAGRVCKYIDSENRKLGESIALPDITQNGSGVTTIGKQQDDDSEYTMYVCNEVGIYGVLSDGKMIEILSWLNSSMSSVNRNLIVLNPDTVLCCIYSGQNTNTVFLKRVPDDEIAEKYTIKLAYQSTNVNSYIVNYAAQFNRENEKYQVTLIDYTSSWASDFSSYQLLDLDIVSGKSPDMFLLDSNYMTGEEYEKKGLFCDLYEYMDKDSEMSRDYFLSCAKTQFEYDGKLYKITDSIRPATVAGKTEIIGSERGWSISDMLDLNDSLSEDASLFRSMGKYEALLILMRGMNEFVDSESGTCSFDSDKFIRYLEFIAEFPMEYDANFNYENMYIDGRAILCQNVVDSMLTLEQMKQSFGTDDITYIGYPGIGGDGTVIYGGNMYAISAKSHPEIKDGAWEFIKFVMEKISNEVYTISFGIPSTYTGYRNWAENEMKIYNLVTPNGSQGRITEYSESEIKRSGGVQIKFTQEDTDNFLDFLESLTGTDKLDSKIEEIITEELNIFLGGGKSALQTADMIQSRVSIYLSE